MGLEAVCHVELGAAAGEAKAHLDGVRLALRGDIDATFELAQLDSVQVEDGVLKAKTKLGPLRIHLGAKQAAKWQQNILAPPTLATKLGVRPGCKVHLTQPHSEVQQMLDELGAQGGSMNDAQLVFAVIETKADLDGLEALVSQLPAAAHLWVLRRKGKAAQVKEGEIMVRLKGKGMAPSKTAAWSDLYGADRYGRARR